MSTPTIESLAEQLRAIEAIKPYHLRNVPGKAADELDRLATALAAAEAKLAVSAAGEVEALREALRFYQNEWYLDTLSTGWRQRFPTYELEQDQGRRASAALTLPDTARSRREGEPS